METKDEIRARRRAERAEKEGTRDERRLNALTMPMGSDTIVIPTDMTLERIVVHKRGGDLVIRARVIMDGAVLTPDPIIVTEDGVTTIPLGIKVKTGAVIEIETQAKGVNAPAISLAYRN